MSSVSQKTPPKTPTTIPKKVDLAIVGSGWEAWFAAELAAQRNIAVALFETDLISYRGPEVIHVGNGEIFERALLAFGESLGNTLWSYSEANLKLAQSFSEAPAVVAWHLEDEKAQALGEKSTKRKSYYRVTDHRLEEDGLWFHPAQAIAKIKSRSSFPVINVTGVVTPSLAGSMEYEVAGNRATLVLLLDDRSLLATEKSLAAEVIPVTLSIFEGTPTGVAPSGYQLFNGGADFSLRRDNFFSMGSIRNLFADKGVGFHTQVDPVSRENITKFFSKKGWLAQAGDEALKYVSLSCDGLPVVGNIPGREGIFYASGFSGRGGNFLFAVLNDLLSDIVEGKASRVPEFLSNRRFL